jgi:catechol 2,3-dioxygenase-like lactoylglutathione lyase family enzyme
MDARARLENIAPVFVSTDLERTAGYYRDVFGFEVVEHFEAEEPFAALYRDSVEIIVVQADKGAIESNQARHGAGFDAYLDPDSVEAVDLFHAELEERGARILSPPAPAPYGCYEFVVEDIDGRRIGIGRIRDRDVFFGEKPVPESID